MQGSQHRLQPALNLWGTGRQQRLCSSPEPRFWPSTGPHPHVSSPRFSAISFSRCAHLQAVQARRAPVSSMDFFESGSGVPAPCPGMVPRHLYSMLEYHSNVQIQLAHKAQSMLFARCLSGCSLTIAAAQKLGPDSCHVMQVQIVVPKTCPVQTSGWPAVRKQMCSGARSLQMALQKCFLHPHTFR